YPCRCSLGLPVLHQFGKHFSEQQCMKYRIEQNYDIHRISGGLSAFEGAWSWQVSIQQMSRHICGGSIISHWWVITASQLAGVNSRSRHGKGFQYHSVQQVIQHEKFNRSNYDNDVALLHLHHPLYFTKHVQPVCIMENEMDKKQLSFSSCYITGWGCSVLEGIVFNTLQEAEVNLIDTGICNQRSWYNGHVNDNMICALTKEELTCQGDSGGPLQCDREDMQRFYLYGVTSHGQDCALPNKPGIYTIWLRNAVARSGSAASVTDLPVFKLISALLFSAWMGLLM
uniref:Transmembrane serine protease 12 n=1 Tax=Cyprinus carpio TaxID=7962 RepID=A0A8C1TWL6_CYPCA